MTSTTNAIEWGGRTLHPHAVRAEVVSERGEDLLRVERDLSVLKSIYLRPNAGRAPDRFVRNHAVQYFAYPDHKFARLRREAPSTYETCADIGLDEWVTMRVEFRGRHAALYLDDGPRPALTGDGLRGSTGSGTVGLWVDVGTEGCFKDLRILQQVAPAPDGAAGV